MLVFMLLLLPIISYIFLKDGFQYRKVALEELDAHEPLDSVLLNAVDTSFTRNNVVLFDFGGNSETVTGIYEQFKNVDQFRLVTTSQQIAQIDPVKVVYVSAEKLGSYTKMDDGGSAPIFLLVDMDGMVRRKYLREEERNDLVKHIATLLPFVGKRQDHN